MLKLLHNDKQRFISELSQLPQWQMGGIAGERAVLLAAGLPQDMVFSFVLTGVPPIDAVNVVASLENFGHLVNRPTHSALGALVQYVMDNTPHIEGKLFLAYLLEQYHMITSEAELEKLRQEYALLSIPRQDTTLNFDWNIRQPAFTWQGPTNEDLLERIWHEDIPFLDAVFLEKGSRAAQSVCRVESMFSGTGFLIGPNLILTNHHVVPSESLAKATTVRFGYRIDAAGQLQPGETYSIASILRQSPRTELDYAVLQLSDSPGEKVGLGFLKFSGNTVEVNSRLYIIQHPRGAPQKVVLQGNKVTYVADDGRRVQYLTNTEKGSSGSPVFNEQWEVVALHHSGGPVPALSNSSNMRGNEGIPIKAILPEIQDLLPASPPKQVNN